MVATREGGVDRNWNQSGTKTALNGVATREGGVDRNILVHVVRVGVNKSPPARVAWIETMMS